MFTAEEAFKKSEEAQKRLEEEEFEKQPEADEIAKVEKGIMEIIEAGRRKYAEFDTLTDEMIRKLQASGFEVRLCDDKDGYPTYYVVDWNKPKNIQNELADNFDQNQHDDILDSKKPK